MKRERIGSVKLKNQHHSTLIADIKLSALCAHGKKISDLKYFNHAVVKFEHSSKSRDIPQRHLCGDFGRTRTY